MSSAKLSPSYYGYVGSTKDALLIIQAIVDKQLELISRRPHERERPALIKSGNVFVFIEEHSGIKRWTDGIAWSPSRILGRFLVYRELDKHSLNEKDDKKKKKRKINNNDDSNMIPSAHHLINDHQQHLNDDKNLVGSLVTSYVFKDQGLIKKTLSLSTSSKNVHIEKKLENQTIHLISYYNADDVLNGKLQRPSETDLKNLQISNTLWEALKDSSLGGKISIEDEAYYFLDTNYQLQNMSLLQHPSLPPPHTHGPPHPHPHGPPPTHPHGPPPPHAHGLPPPHPQINQNIHMLPLPLQNNHYHPSEYIPAPAPAPALAPPTASIQSNGPSPRYTTAPPPTYIRKEDEINSELSFVNPFNQQSQFQQPQHQAQQQPNLFNNPYMLPPQQFQPNYISNPPINDSSSFPQSNNQSPIQQPIIPQQQPPPPQQQQSPQVQAQSQVPTQIIPPGPSSKNTALPPQQFAPFPPQHFQQFLPQQPPNHFGSILTGSSDQFSISGNSNGGSISSIGSNMMHGTNSNSFSAAPPNNNTNKKLMRSIINNNSGWFTTAPGSTTGGDLVNTNSTNYSVVASGPAQEDHSNLAFNTQLPTSTTLTNEDSSNSSYTSNFTSTN